MDTIKCYCSPVDGIGDRINATHMWPTERVLFGRYAYIIPLRTALASATATALTLAL